MILARALTVTAPDGVNSESSCRNIGEGTRESGFKIAPLVFWPV